MNFELHFGKEKNVTPFKFSDKKDLIDFISKKIFYPSIGLTLWWFNLCGQDFTIQFKTK